MRLRTATVLAIFSVIGVARSDSLSDRRATKDKVEDIAVEIACGKSDKENCAIVVPEINNRTVASHIRLQPLESKGSVESTDGLCDGDVNIAVVQGDVLAKRAEKTDCTGKLAVLGSPLYPYVGFMVASSKTDANSFSDMIGNLPEGKVLQVAAGGSGSGGEFTLRVVLANHPDWKTRVSIVSDGADTALTKLQDRQIDAFFVMDGPKSPLLETVKNTVDGKSKQPAYKFVDFRPNAATLAMTYDNGRPLYTTVVVDPGFWSSTKTIATPAITAVRNDWYSAHAKLARTMRQASEDALPNIAARAGAKPDWANDFAPR